LHKIHDRRNILAHTAEARASWTELSETIDKIQATLEHLGLVKEKPCLDYFAERSAIKSSDEPGIAFVQEFTCGITENGKIAMKFGWVEKTYNDSDTEDIV
jgi:hypothetical protein